MQIKDHPTVKKILATHATSSLFFFRELEQVSGLELLSALMRINGLTRDQAIATWKILKPPRHRVTSGEIKNFIQTFNASQRKAILFGLETRLSLEEIILLRWDRINTVRLTSTASQILRSLPRHLFTNFVFWEYNAKEEAKPLVSLLKTFNLNSAMTWLEVTAHHHDAIMVDIESDTRELEAIIHTLA